VATLSRLIEDPARPLVAILGGAKVSDKIGVIDRFLDVADAILVGGAMAFPFLAAEGHSIGDSLCDDADVELARGALAAAEGSACRLELPRDLVLGDRFDAGAQRRELDGVDVPDGWMGLDIGPRTAEDYSREIAAAGTVFWNGPMGAFELEPFAAGTRKCGKHRLGATAQPQISVPDNTGGDLGLAAVSAGAYRRHPVHEFGFADRAHLDRTGVPVHRVRLHKYRRNNVVAGTGISQEVVQHVAISGPDPEVVMRVYDGELGFERRLLVSIQPILAHRA